MIWKVTNNLLIMWPCTMNNCMQLPCIPSTLWICLIYIHTSYYLSYTRSHYSPFECKIHNMGSARRRQKWCSQKFNTVSKQKAAITCWNSTRNTSQLSTTQHPGNPLYKTSVYIYKIVHNTDLYQYRSSKWNRYSNWRRSHHCWHYGWVLHLSDFSKL